MAIAVVATLLTSEVGDYGLIALGIAIGTAVGVPAARSVKMTAMPQMVALFNGVGGGAVALIAWAEYRARSSCGRQPRARRADPDPVRGDRRLGLLLGLEHRVRQAPGDPPGPPDPAARASSSSTSLLLARRGRLRGGDRRRHRVARGCSSLILVAAALLGNMFVLPIGGADMPVVISLLNAFTGLSAAAAGIALDNVALIVGGMLVGASGSILTNADGRGDEPLDPEHLRRRLRRRDRRRRRGGDGEQKPVRSTDAADVAIQLAYASKVVVAPGYGMAVAQAQHTVRELADELEKRGIRVDYAIHPVAGRMPGHMNVLLAEADVPYDHLKEMDEINPEFPQTDVALVIGANDVTNPAAREDEGSPIYGMPILDVDKAAQVIVLKRSMNTGFAGHRQPALLQRQHRAAVRRRQGVGGRRARRGQGALGGARRAQERRRPRASGRTDRRSRACRRG